MTNLLFRVASVISFFFKLRASRRVRGAQSREGSVRVTTARVNRDGRRTTSNRNSKGVTASQNAVFIMETPLSFKSRASSLKDEKQERILKCLPLNAAMSARAARLFTRFAAMALYKLELFAGGRRGRTRTRFACAEGPLTRVRSG